MTVCFDVAIIIMFNDGRKVKIASMQKANNKTSLDERRKQNLPKADFWSLSGALNSSIVLTDAELTHARGAFSKQWAKKI